MTDESDEDDDVLAVCANLQSVRVQRLPNLHSREEDDEEVVEAEEAVVDYKYRGQTSNRRAGQISKHLKD